MTAREIMERLFTLSEPKDFSNTCDTLKAGDPDREINKVAVAMFATPQLISSAAEWGAELLIVHEPLYYNDKDEHSLEIVECKKRALVDQTGMTVWRFHDHAHVVCPDMIAAGQLRALDLSGKMQLTSVFDLVRLQLDEAITPQQLKTLIEEKWGLRHVRLCGSTDKPCHNISCMFGAPGSAAFDELKNPDCEILLIGETTEWSAAEYARDADQLGYTKALFILGHEGSEREGMVYIADVLKETLPELTVKYFESGEVY